MLRKEEEIHHIVGAATAAVSASVDDDNDKDNDDTKHLLSSDRNDDLTDSKLPYLICNQQPDKDDESVSLKVDCADNAYHNADNATDALSKPLLVHASPPSPDQKHVTTAHITGNFQQTQTSSGPLHTCSQSSMRTHDGGYSTVGMLYHSTQIKPLMLVAIYNGASLAFLAGIFPLLIRNKPNRYLGLAAAGLANIFSAYFFGWLSDRFAREFVILFGAILHGATYGVYLSPLARACPDFVLVIGGGMFGAGDAILNTQTYAVISKTFTKNTSAAFAGYKMFQGIGASLLFFAHVHTSWDLKIICLVCCLGMCTLILMLKARRLRLARLSFNITPFVADFNVQQQQQDQQHDTDQRRIFSDNEQIHTDLKNSVINGGHEETRASSSLRRRQQDTLTNHQRVRSYSYPQTHDDAVVGTTGNDM